MLVKKRSVLLLAPYPIGEAPSQRFRFEQHLDHLSEEYNIDFQSFYFKQFWDVLYKKNRLFLKALFLFVAFGRRFGLLFRLHKYEIVFVHREITPIGPPIIEWCIIKLLRKKIIYDFDDAIWLPNVSDVNRKLVGWMKFHSKVASIIRWSTKVSVGNHYLKDFAMHYNTQVVVVPTTIDLNYHRSNRNNRELKKEGRVRIGWTGSHSTVQYLNRLDQLLSEINEDYPIEFVVISDRKPQLRFKHLEFVPWNKTEEIEQLERVDIGVMPLESDDWALGKCAFKAIQFMALGIPCVVSPIGANLQVVRHNENGFHASTDDEWKQAIVTLIQDQEKYNEFSLKAKEQIAKNYSKQALEVAYRTLLNPQLCVE